MQLAKVPIQTNILIYHDSFKFLCRTRKEDPLTLLKMATFEGVVFWGGGKGSLGKCQDFGSVQSYLLSLGCFKLTKMPQ